MTLHSIPFALDRAKWEQRTAGCRKRVAPEFSTFHVFHFSLYQDGTKWVCTVRDVPGTKTSGRNGKMWKVENSGATRFLQPAVTGCIKNHFFFTRKVNLAIAFKYQDQMVNLYVVVHYKSKARAKESI
jgi:hypothetical protein